MSEAKAKAARLGAASVKPEGAAGWAASSKERDDMIRLAAYHIAERSRFKLNSQDCWAAGEAQVDLLLSLRESQQKLNIIVDSALDAVVTIDSDGNITGWNPQATAIFGWSRDEAIGQPIHQMIIPQRHREAHTQGMRRYLESGEGSVLNKRIEIQALHRRGYEFAVELTIAPIRTEGRLEFSAFLRDISERKRHEGIQAARMRLMEYAPGHSLEELLVATLDEAGRLTESLIGFYHFLDADQKTLSLQAWSTRTTAEYCTAAGAGNHYPIDEAGVWVECVRVRHAVIHNDYAALPNRKGLPPGHAPVLREMVVPVFRNGLIVAILGVGNKATPYTEQDMETTSLLADMAWDFAEAKRADAAFRESEKRWQFALEGAGDGVWDWNVQTNAVHFSRRWKEMLGYADGDIGGSYGEWEKLIHPDDLAKALATVQSYLAGETHSFVLESRLRCRDGGWKWILARGMIVSRTPEGKPLRMIGTHSDITDRKEAELQISFMAYHDRLTGLPNRALFFDRFSQAISQARRNHKRVALLFIDLDGFKQVNDRYGHDVGDVVLKTTAERFLSSVRAMDTVARTGGDEFAVILGELENPEEVVPIATKLIEAGGREIVLPGGLACSVGASIGVSFYPDNGTEMDALLLAADKAMYQSKSGGKGKFTYSGNPPAPVSGGAHWAGFGDAYLLGVAEIDAQHRELSVLIDDINQAISNQTDASSIRRMFANLLEYTRFHFATEHELMERYRYPEQAAHDMEHAHLLAEAMHFRTRINRGGDRVVLQSIRDWLLHHIITQDKPLAEFLKRRPAQ